MTYMFADCTMLKTLDLSSFDMRHVEYMKGMFLRCTNLSTSIHLNGRPIRKEYAFEDAATAKDAKIYVSYGGDCDRELAFEIVNTKGLDSHVYLREAKKVTGLEASNVTEGIKITWEQQADVDGYQVYRKAEGDSAYKRVKTTKETFYTDSSLSDAMWST